MQNWALKTNDYILNVFIRDDALEETRGFSFPVELEKN